MHLILYAGAWLANVRDCTSFAKEDKYNGRLHYLLSLCYRSALLFNRNGTPYVPYMNTLLINPVVSFYHGALVWIAAYRISRYRTTLER